MIRNKSRIVDNPIVFTYPRYDIGFEYGTMEEIYEWLKPYGLVGIAKTLGPGYKLKHRVYAKLDPKILALFFLKFNPTVYTKFKPYSVLFKEHDE